MNKQKIEYLTEYEYEILKLNLSVNGITFIPNRLLGIKLRSESDILCRGRRQLGATHHARTCHFPMTTITGRVFRYPIGTRH